MIVMKFGGSSLATPDRIRRCLGLVEARLEQRPAVVVSACGKTTDRLIEAAREATRGRVDLEPVLAIQRPLIEGLALGDDVTAPLLDELAGLLHGVSLLGELTDRTLDRVMSFGERLSTRVVAAAARSMGFAAEAVRADEVGLLTDDRHGAASPLPEIDEGIRAALEKVEGVPILTGFIGRGPDGHTTTLGRSGSDFSAAIFAAALEAKQLQIWTDVNGVMTCDPSLDPRAQNLPRLSFDEASELAYFGAEVLHPSTLVPAIRKGIPVVVLNTMAPDDGGTTIVARPALGSRFAKAVAYKEDVAVIALSSPRLQSAAGLLAAALEILNRHRVGIHMATTSEATVSLVTLADFDPARLGAAHAELAALGQLTVERDKTIICVVGEELKGRAGVLGAIFGAVAGSGIKAKLVSQSASELNVAFLVDNTERDAAVRALHELILRPGPTA